MKRHCVFVVLVVFVLSNFQDLQAQQVNWCGVKRDGHFQEKGLLKQWPENDPEKIRSVEGAGMHWAHPYIYKGKLFIRHRDVLTVYNVKENS